MPDRVQPGIISTIYTDTNPENIIPAKKGALFFRREKNFYVNHSGNLNGQWLQLPYLTVILPRPDPRKLIIYEHKYMVFEKTTDGYLDEFKEIMPKTGWKFYSYEDVFAAAPPRDFGWYPNISSPSSSYDPIGVDGARHYDENFYYYKTGSLWYRTPIARFSSPGVDIGEQPNRYSNSPFVVIPRFLPVPQTTNTTDDARVGDQTYDRDFFYIKPSKWKRSPLETYDASTMTMF